MKRETVKCDICGSDKSRLLYRKHKFAYVKCSVCGLVYIRSRITQTDFKEEAEHLARTRQLTEAKIKSDYSDFIQEIIYRPRLDLMEEYRENGMVLDIGCGNGAFMYSAVTRGWRAIGVELIESSALYARENRGLDVRAGTILDIKFADEYFDVITMWETLEHLSAPSNYLREVNRILRMNGAVLISTPNVNSLTRFLIHNRWEVFSPDKHLYLFSDKTITTLFEKTGFKIIKLWTEDINLLTIIRNSKSSKRSDDWIEKRQETVKFTNMFRKYRSLIKVRQLINGVLSNIRIGDTLYVLAQKSCNLS